MFEVMRRVESQRLRLLRALAIFLLYSAAFPYIYELLRPNVGPVTLAMLPILALGWLMGTGGVLAGTLISVPLTAALVVWFAGEAPGNLFDSGPYQGTALLALLALGMGWLRDLSTKVQSDRTRLEEEIIERQRTEQALRDSEARYRLMIEGSSELFFYRHDADHQFTYLSPSVREVVGFDVEELLGQPYDVLLTGDSTDEVVTNLTESALQTGSQQSSYQALVRHKDGRLIWLELVESPIEQDGIVTGVQGFARDITARKQGELVQSILYAVSEAVHETPDLPTLLESIHHSLGRLLNVRNFFVALCEGDSRDTFSFPYLVDEWDDGDDETGYYPGSLTARVARTGEPLLVDSEGIQKLIEAGELALYGTLPHQWLGLPLKIRERVIGVVVLQSYTDHDRFSQREVVLMGFVAKQIASAIERKRAEQALLDSQSSLQYMAHHDALTHLPNRVLFYDRLGQAIAQASRYGRMTALLYIDLDNFKSVNDTFGHSAGDRVLQEVAQRLLNCVRESDTVARMGGDEFTIILTQIEKKEAAEEIARKILTVLSVPFELETNSWLLTTSIGLSVFPIDSLTADELVKHADHSMYQAKDSGKNNLHRAAEQGEPAVTNQASRGDRAS